MQGVNQRVSSLGDACTLCNVCLMDAPYLFPTMRGCCREWCQLLPKYTRIFRLAVKHLRRLSAMRCEQLYRGSNIAPIRRELLQLSRALNASQSESVPNLLWQNQHLFWRYLKLPNRIPWSWMVRQKAALILHDLCSRYGYSDIERKLVDLHEEAWRICRFLQPFLDEGPAPGLSLYEALRGLPLKFQTIQLNAALVAGESGWLRGGLELRYIGEEESHHLSLENLPSTPDVSSDTAIADTQPSCLLREPINSLWDADGPRVGMGRLDRVYW